MILRRSWQSTKASPDLQVPAPAKRRSLTQLPKRRCRKDGPSRHWGEGGGQACSPLARQIGRQPQQSSATCTVRAPTLGCGATRSAGFLGSDRRTEWGGNRSQHALREYFLTGEQGCIESRSECLRAATKVVCWWLVAASCRASTLSGRKTSRVAHRPHPTMDSWSPVRPRKKPATQRARRRASFAVARRPRDAAR